MASNQEKIIDHYSGYQEDNRAKESRSASLEFHYTKQILSEFIKLESCVIELGCATGYYDIYFADKCAEYTGVDISPDHIAVFHERIIAEKKENIRAVVGDATALSVFSDNSFDIVLCLGPMYHLPHEERLEVFDECYRIARSGAVLAFAYINGLGAYVAACVHDKLRSTYPIGKKIGIGEYYSHKTKLVELNPQNKPMHKVIGERAAERYSCFIDEDSACSACYSSLVYALHRLGGKVHIDGKIHIGQGFKGKSGTGIGIGNCASGFTKCVAGCPPKATDIIKHLF